MVYKYMEPLAVPAYIGYLKLQSVILFIMNINQLGFSSLFLYFNSIRNVYGLKEQTVKYFRLKED